MSKYFEIKFLVVFSLLSALFLQADAQNGMIDSLRLVNSVSGNVITGISMKTDSSLSVKIQVVWSDDVAKTLVDGTGTWKLTPDTIKWDANPPSEAGSWTISPKTPGNENLTVTSGSVSKLIPITITPASPSRISIQLASPADSIIAGRPFKIVVEMWNVDGLVPGVSCSTSVTVTDALGNDTKTAIPTIILSGNPTPIPLGQPTGVCFNNGLDTISITLYNAPMSLDSTHRITLTLTNQSGTLLTISTDPFHLFPGPTISFKLEYSNGNPIHGPDTLYYPNGVVNIYTRGYDQYGNFIGNIRSTWTKTGTLPSFTPPTTNQVNVYIDASNAIIDEAGWVKASAPSGISGNTVSDSVQVIIVPRKANFATALTKDINGNGFLDQIWLTFDKPIPVSDTATITVRNVIPNVNFIIDSLRSMNSGSDTTSTYIIYLRDSFDIQNGIHLRDSLGTQTGAFEHPGATPETSWRPLLSISGLKGANDFNGKQCQDGAGPVIWSVILARNSATDRLKDLVTVTFSEPIQKNNGAAFSIATPPNLVLDTWKKDGNSFVSDASLDFIDGFFKIVNPTTVQFYMTNKSEIDSLEYFTIRIPNYVTDQANPANPPVASNQRVQVWMLNLYPPQSDNKPGCGCGSGTGLAFIPPLGFKAKSWWNRKKKGKCKRFL